MKKPISPRVHALLDYGLAGFLLLAPRLFKLKGAARTLAYGFSSGMASNAAFSNQPAALRPSMAFQTHKTLDKGNLAAMLLLPAVTGVMKKPTARNLFLGAFVAVLANVLLTDWDSEEE